MTDIYDRIKQDHDRARDLISQIKATSDQAAKKREELFEAFKLDMWTHNKVEEATFYTKLEQKGDEKESMEARNEHHMVNAMLDELDTMPKDNPEWAQKFSVLTEILDHHMKEEENEFFELAHKDLSDDEAEDLGESFEERRKTVKPALLPVD